jgi:hypothetical protein
MSATATAVPSAPVAGPYRLPPGPGFPTVVNATLFHVAHYRFGRWVHRRYGDVATIRLPNFGTAVFIANRDLVKAVHTTRADVLHAGETPLGALLGPGSVFSMDEERHLAERRMLLPPLHGERMHTYDGLVEEEALRAFAAWPDGVEVETLPTFARITLRVILRAVFGAKGAHLAELEEMLPGMTVLGQRLIAVRALRRDLGPWSPGGRFRRMRQRFDRIVDELIQEHLDDPRLDERDDILALILRTLQERGEAINRQHLSDELLTLLTAGHETTASSLAWAVERLRRHPAILHRLEEEVAAGGRALRDATILEVLRTRPVVTAHVRIVKKPYDLGEWRLPPGTVLFVNAVAMHGDDRWHEPASTFDPGRYLEAKPDTYAWVPFGGGVRRCLGASFAHMEMNAVLRTLLDRFELVPTSAPGEREVFRGVATAPADGGRAVVRRRAAPLAGAAGDAGATAAACPVGHAGG